MTTPERTVEEIVKSLIEYVEEIDRPEERYQLVKFEVSQVIHQELQKARKSERKIIKLRIDYDRRKGIPAEETVNDIYDSIELKDQSELDQPK